MLLQRQHHAVGDDGKQHRVLEGWPLDDELCIPENKEQVSCKIIFNTTYLLPDILGLINLYDCLLLYSFFIIFHSIMTAGCPIISAVQFTNNRERWYIGNRTLVVFS